MNRALVKLVRHKNTRAYLGNDGAWTHDAGSARQFTDIQNVLQLQRELDLKEIEMVLQMGEEPSKEYDISLPLDAPLR